MCSTKQSILYYWNGLTITFFIYKFIEIYYKALSLRISFFVLQRLLRTPIIVMAAISYYNNAWLIWTPGIITEIGNIYFEIRALIALK